MKDKKLCDEIVWSKDDVRHYCTNPAKYRYKVKRSMVEHLCGVHARRFKGSPNLTPYTEDNTSVSRETK